MASPTRPNLPRVKYRLEGRASVHAQMAQNKGKPHPVPLIHNLIIDLDGDHATSTCVMEGIIYGTSYGFQGEYHDTFRREGSRWLFSERIFTMFRAASPV